jgi:hypothetical protein
MLSTGAKQLIHDYLNLPCGTKEGIRCPYINNAKLNQRGQLRVLVGKGTPEEIVEEANIISTQYKAGIFDKDAHQCLCDQHSGKQFTLQEIRKFLIDHHLGIECSGFVTHVLDKHFQEANHINLVKKLHIVSPAKIIRWMISRLRRVENISVKTYVDKRNTTAIVSDAIGWDYNKINPADIIILLETGLRHNKNHIILITENKDNILKYVHARAWPSEGQYDHGVTEGMIKITHPGKSLSEQEWIERGKTGNENGTFQEILQAKLIEIRRVKI